MIPRTGVIFDPTRQTCIFDHSWEGGGGRADRRQLGDARNGSAPPLEDSFAEDARSVAQLKAQVAALEEENSRLRHELVVAEEKAKVVGGSQYMGGTLDEIKVMLARLSATREDENCGNN